MILNPDNYSHYIDGFNAAEAEEVVNLIPNAASFDFIRANCPLLDCPDKTIEEVYYFRWWTFRKHLIKTPAGNLMTEFILPVKHAGIYNTVSCALGHHIAEGRWLRDQSWLDQYVRFWYRGHEGGPQPHFHKYSQWTAAALLDRAHVTGDFAFLADLLGDLVADEARWENEKHFDDGLFWQYDVWDGMEESISGSRMQKNRRPTINSYMYGNASAIAQIARHAGDNSFALSYVHKAQQLRRLILEKLWDPQARFFKVMFEDGSLSDAREAIGFIPWWFGIPTSDHAQAWQQLTDPQGFDAPFGITTAERRHPKFRSHGVGHCEWDGAVWPFATSQTLNAMATYLRNSENPVLGRAEFLRAVQTYAQSQHRAGQAYIGEYLDETTGEWLKNGNPRSRFYNHSTFCDLVISHLVGLVPREDDTIELDPLLPTESWDWFCLDNVRYHRRKITIIWDRTGGRYNRGAGLSLWINDKQIAHSPNLQRVTAPMDAS